MSWRKMCNDCNVRPADYEFDWNLGDEDGTMLWIVCKQCRKRKRYKDVKMRKYHNKDWEIMMEKKWPR